MDLFRLTYFVAGSEKDDKWLCSNRYEIYGSAEAICNMYFNLNCLKELKEKNIHESACPMFMEIYNKDGRCLTEVYKKQGTLGVSSNSCNTFE